MKKGKPFDETKAMKIYKKSMEYELQVFIMADKLINNITEDFFMSSSKIFNLDRIAKGQFMSWFVTTQAANKITVKLYDDSKVYFEASKRSVNIEPPLAQGAAFVSGNNLKLQITSSGSNELQTWYNMSDILSKSADAVGEVFTLAAEDYTDNDYNDVYVSISSWNKAR